MTTAREREKHALRVSHDYVEYVSKHFREGNESGISQAFEMISTMLL